MTTKEMNRDIKRLNESIKKVSGTGDAYYQFIAGNAKTEFMRLYRADNHFEGMNKQSVLIMLRLNLRHNFMPLHVFGIFIEI